MDHATCRSCGAPIVWAKTESGKRMPLDATPQKRAVLDDLAIRLGAEPTARVVDTYVSHFATCPNAAQHRKKPEPR